MSICRSSPCTAFAGPTRIAAGTLADVALALRDRPDAGEPVLVFDDQSGAVIDLDLRGSDAEILERLAPDPGATPARGRGRPKLGVIAREVTLLPRHWDWLAAQPGGASQVLRRLVDAARRADGSASEARAARDRTYRVLSAIAGDLPGYEEAIRALFMPDEARFHERMGSWPPDIRTYALELLKTPSP